MTLLLAILLAGSIDAGRVRAGGDWSIEISTSGGFTGSGFGNMLADSSGKLVVSANRTKCESMLTPAELADVAAIIKGVRADLWRPSYLPADQRAWCCDMFFITVKLRRQERNSRGRWETVVYRTEFINEQSSEVPGDLRTAFRRLWSAAEPQSLSSKYLSTCRK